ncbi:hypothetical protein [Verrucomicrobium sp. BvORR034]|jgi:hypothetical protein|uniref:hypothetical protein n=1 Tax=Verrucomicrobium sp. BvORR034 TaxID=1396418 RepID=UPI0006791986|nr:hypothetical protein [Verrucomicrobium sp. BvORR034]
MQVHTGVSSPATDSRRHLARWRADAARLAAQLLCEVSPSAADEVLDLRMMLLDSQASAQSVLSVFFAARNRLESEHYLLFFRLRRVLEPSFGLETTAQDFPARQESVNFHCRDLRHLTRRAQQEAFESDLRLNSPEEVSVRIVWRLSPYAEPASI